MLAVVTWFCVSHPFIALSLWVCVSCCMMSWWLEKPVLFIVSVALLASSLGVRAEQAYVMLETQRYEGKVVLVDDPEPQRYGQAQFVGRIESGKRVVIDVPFALLPRNDDLAAGDTMRVKGSIKRLFDAETSGSIRSWYKSNHLVGRMTLTSVTSVEKASGLRAVPEFFRDAIDKGAFMSEGEKSLYMGLVIGDDRFQSEVQQAHFRATGITHLLAVSGQNVVLLLALAAPLLQRLPLHLRFLCVIFLLAGFGIVTRFEPSVIRAVGVAVVVAWGRLQGAQTTGLRVLLLSVTGLVLVDPFLTLSLGFRLSVAASLGIIVLAPVLMERIAVARRSAIVESVIVTISAQLFVAPLLLGFGPIPSISVAANLFVGWAAGYVMIWGSSVGVIAGLLPSWLSWLGFFVQLPVRALLWWIASAAKHLAQFQAPMLGGLALVVICGASLAWILLKRHGTIRRVFSCMAILAVVGFSIWSPTAAVFSQEESSVLWIPGDSESISVLWISADANRSDIDRFTQLDQIDLVVVETGTRQMSEHIARLQATTHVRAIWAPSNHKIKGAQRVLSTQTIKSSVGQLQINSEEKRLALVR